MRDVVLKLSEPSHLKVIVTRPNTCKADELPVSLSCTSCQVLIRKCWTGKLKVQCVGGRGGVYWKKLNVIITVMLLPYFCNSPKVIVEESAASQSFSFLTYIIFLSQWILIDCLLSVCVCVQCVRLTIWALTRVKRAWAHKTPVSVCQWILILKTAWGLKRQLKRAAYGAGVRDTCFNISVLSCH